MKKKTKKTTKDRIINVRISKKTYEKMLHSARNNSESISNVLRKLIDDTFDIAQEVRQDILGKEERKSDAIITYYKATAGIKTKCTKCGKSVKKGTAIIIGESNSGKKYSYCTKCK